MRTDNIICLATHPKDGALDSHFNFCLRRICNDLGKRFSVFCLMKQNVYEIVMYLYFHDAVSKFFELYVH